MKIAFMHIPKTAGTTFRKMLQRNLHARPQVLIYSRDGTRQFRALDYVAKSQFDLAAGHVGFDVLEPLGTTHMLMSFVRDPVERVVSHYNFSMVDRSHPKHIRMQTEGWTFDRFLEESGKKMFNQQVAFFAGLADSEGPFDTEAALNQAMQNLDAFQFVGAQKLFDLCLLFVRHKYGFDVRYTRERVSLTRIVTSPSVKHLSVLRERCWADYVLYSHVLRRLVPQIFSRLGLSNIAAKFEVDAATLDNWPAG